MFPVAVLAAIFYSPKYFIISGDVIKLIAYALSNQILIMVHSSHTLIKVCVMVRFKRLDSTVRVSTCYLVFFDYNLINNQESSCLFVWLRQLFKFSYVTHFSE